MVDLAILRDKILYLDIYHAYKAFMKRYEELGVPLHSYGDDECDLLEGVTEYYSVLKKPDGRVPTIQISPEEMKEILDEEFRDFFKGSSYFIYKNLLHNLELDPTFPMDMCDVTGRKIVLNSFDNNQDLASLMYYVSHILVYQKDHNLAYSEIIPFAFRLIVADILSKRFDIPYVAEELTNQLDLFVFNLYVNLLYPSLTPVFIPYSIGTLMSNEVYLRYRNDRERFIVELGRILNGDVTVKQYLKDIKSPVDVNSIDKIKENHSLILFNNC